MEAELAPHNGDSAARRALRSCNEPVSGAVGRDDYGVHGPGVQEQDRRRPGLGLARREDLGRRSFSVPALVEAAVA